MAIAALCAAALYRHDGAIPDAPRQAQPGPAPTPAAPTAQPPAPLPSPSAQLFTTEDGSLIVDPGLLDTIEFFLVVHPGRGIAGLNDFLAQRLPAAARREALRIAADYQVYMKEYDAVLAAHNLQAHAVPVASVDLARIDAWARQRSRLRQTMFGIDVARRWFDNDDVRLAQAIEELRHGATAAGATEPGPDPRHAPGPALLRDEAAQRALYLQRLLDDATTSFRERLGR
ncbi:hypothetical protein HH212_23525 [Massilia forsythiae]|uniref:Lipase modulator n=1 Tax=Massilia forsythiae TaxID=2728020 RepID=A0A7Z2ZVZ0_9BURK|nr:hypothetical protein [Massilia forsythiae]QJE02622.1 hypothetical protein HH212_23525 [Massilia forsythiae]